MGVNEVIQILETLSSFMLEQSVGDDPDMVNTWHQICTDIEKLYTALEGAKSNENWLAEVQAIQAIQTRVAEVTTTDSFTQDHVKLELDECVKLLQELLQQEAFYMSRIDPSDESRKNIGQDTMKSLFEKMRNEFYTLVECLNQESYNTRVKELGATMCVDLQLLLLNMARTCWTNEHGNAQQYEKLLDTKNDLLKFNHITRRTVYEFMEGLTRYERETSEEGSFKNKIIRYISNLSGAWNAIWWAEDVDETDISAPSGHDESVRSLLMHLKLFC
jgi:hypothetical protein